MNPTRGEVRQYEAVKSRLALRNWLALVAVTSERIAEERSNHG